jgi:hypothetical protein
MYSVLRFAAVGGDGGCLGSHACVACVLSTVIELARLLPLLLLLLLLPGNGIPLHVLMLTDACAVYALFQVIVMASPPHLQGYGFDTFRQQEDLDEFLFNLHWAARAHQRRPGVLFVETFRTCTLDKSDCDKHCPDHRQGEMAYHFAGKAARQPYQYGTGT